MARLNSRQRRKTYEQLRARDGERCNICKRFGNYRTLVVDHCDNNPDNNNLTNLQLLCRRHNYVKNPRGSKAKVRLDARDLAQPKISSAEFLKNTKSEPLFCHWIDRILRKEHRILYEDAINSGAQMAGCSPVTAKRYLDKLTSSVGPCQVYYDDEAGATFLELKTGPVGLGPNLINDEEEREANN
jgi:hypothetical protein